MRFANPEYLYLLILLPVAILLYIYSKYRRNRDIKSYGNPQLLKALIPSFSSIRTKITFWLLFTVLAMIIFVLAQPQFGANKETVTTRGVEVVVALDISNSMLADDISPNRLDKAKRLISRIINKSSENKVALIVFAGDAFVQLPITDDFISAKMFLESISPKLIDRQGTDISAAINLATKSFTPNDKVGKAIVIITDGENHEGGAEEAARQAAEKGINVYVLGIGTEKGGRIPLTGNEYLRDSDGYVVVTKLNEEMARSIAEAGKGMYIMVDNTNNAQTIIDNELDKLAKDDIKTEIYTKYREQFMPIAVITFFILACEIVLNIILDSLSISRRKKNRK